MLLEGMDLQRRSRHIDIKVCWLRELLVKGIVKIQHVKGTGNPADHFTKTLSTAKALEYMTLLVAAHFSDEPLLTRFIGGKPPPSYSPVRASFAALRVPLWPGVALHLVWQKKGNKQT